MILHEVSVHSERNEATLAKGREQALPCFGPWRAVTRLACGGRTDLYRAAPVGKTGAGAPYVLKVLRHDHENIPQSVRRFRQSVEIGRRVSHASIIPVLDFGVAKPPYYMVLPWVEGESLRHRFQAGRPMTVPSLLWVIRQTASALGALFDAGYTHGDVKPENVLVSSDWHATLVDLEFARPIAARPIAARPEASPIPIMGTPPYLAPEIVLSGAAPDMRTDIYALGIVLFEGLAGYSPFRAESPSRLLESLRTGGVPSLRSSLPHLPKRLADLIRSMTAKDPLRRPAGPHEVVSALIDLEIETFPQRQWV